MIKTASNHSIENLDGFIDKILARNFDFFLVLAATETMHHKGISAAGASQEMLPYTAALDAEYLEHEEIKTLEALPVSPSGIVSPAIITKACLNLTGAKHFLVNAGAAVAPQAPTITLMSAIGDNSGLGLSKSVETGNALTIARVEELFDYGRMLAKEYFQKTEDNYLVIGECVVAGTTTALALLKALGYDCEDLVSSSIPNGNHELKNKLVNEGYQNSVKKFGEEFEHRIEEDPLLAVSCMGDPMQAVVTGMAIETIAQDKQAILAGGSQMIAVACLIEKMAKVFALKNEDNLVIATTPWIIKDNSAKTSELAKKVCPKIPLLYCDFDFQSSKHQIFKAYDEGHVKEGVGAGAMILASFLKLGKEGFAQELIGEIDKLYEKQLGLEPQIL